MAEKKSRQQLLWPLGVTLLEREARILVQAEGEKLSLLFYRPGEKKAAAVIDFKEEDRIGDVWGMTISGSDLRRYGLRESELKELEYGFLLDGRWMADPCARILTGRESWGDISRTAGTERARFMSEDFDWREDRRPKIPYSDTILYRLHVRGFTRSQSSGVRAKGTFAGIKEKIPYMKSLGVTSAELMPITEFDEVLRSGGMPPEAREIKNPEPTGLLNYWGYGPSFLYAVKSSYGSGRKKPENELKELVRALHKESMECILELYFTGKEAVGMVLDVLRFWVAEYHIDGFRLSGFPPLAAIAKDPFLKGTKLFAESWSGISGFEGQTAYHEPSKDKLTLRDKHLAEYNDQFQTDMRRFLKGDEGMLSSVAFRLKNNPPEHAVVNYMANTNGMTMMDMVSYDRKHNEENHEDNKDGSDHNFSWNCGEEGPTKKKKIKELRKKQLCNAFLMLFLSQGTPLILAGDEFGNSQGGNNNAYCQDNETSWVDWSMAKANRDVLEFVKRLIAFRKANSVFHWDREPLFLDHKSCGRPDMSYHGEYAWRPEFDPFRRQLGVLYWGPYGSREDGGEGDSFYVLYNMHWEPHVFGLPHLPKGQSWHKICDTSERIENNLRKGGNGMTLKDQAELTVAPRSITILEGKKTDGYYTYETPVGELTIWCKEEKVTGVRFGRVLPPDKAMGEARTALSDRVISQLMEYFEGKRKEFDLPLDPQGTEFQKKVWNALREIPWGETRSYKEIAAAVGDEKACRAVGMANNKNPIAIIIPCHRVVGSNGKLVGYAGGLAIKEKLLALERGQTGNEQPQDRQSEDS